LLDKNAKIDLYISTLSKIQRKRINSVFKNYNFIKEMGLSIELVHKLDSTRKHLVWLNKNKLTWRCDCEGFIMHNEKIECKHIRAVRIYFMINLL